MVVTISYSIFFNYFLARSVFEPQPLHYIPLELIRMFRVPMWLILQQNITVVQNEG